MENYILSIEPHADYLRAYYEAEKDSASLTNLLWKKIRDEMKEKNYQKLLVVENIKKESGTVLELYQFVKLFLTIGFAGKKIAFVDLVEEHYPSNKFGETVAVNLGINGKVFKIEEDALLWLTETKASF